MPTESQGTVFLRHRVSRAVRAVAPIAALAALLSSPHARTAWAQITPPSEYQLKAAFLFNFAKFIDWPSTSFVSPQAPFAICIFGADPFGNAMDEVLHGKAVGGRAVIVERTKDLASARHCQMIFVSSSEKQRVPEILDGLKGSNALVVGETEGFAAAGGTVQFTLEENHVRFVINTDATERAGLKVSSKLLSLARVIHDSGKGDRS